MSSFNAAWWIDDSGRQDTAAIDQAAEGSPSRGSGVAGIGGPVGAAIGDPDVAHGDTQSARRRRGDAVVREQRGLAGNEGGERQEQGDCLDFHKYFQFVGLEDICGASLNVSAVNISLFAPRQESVKLFSFSVTNNRRDTKESLDGGG